MRGVIGGSCGPVERLALRAGYEVASAPYCREGHVYQVGGRVLILAPTWITGQTYRDASIARQLVLYGLAASGEEAFAAGLATMTARHAALGAAPQAEAAD